MDKDDAKVSLAEISWLEDGEPFSEQFEDVFFSTEGAIGESKHVFLSGNNLATRFLNHDRVFFQIAETGFGTGLNFFNAVKSFLKFREKNPQSICRRLIFSSFEYLPLSLSDLQKVHSRWNEFSSISEKLCAQWKLNSKKLQCSFYDNQIELILYFENALTAVLKLQMNQIDAWFLDGFSPDKNAELWSLELFARIFTRTAYNGSFATYSAAGHVRRKLLEVGFNVEKRKGFGKKREMLVGYKMLVL